MIKICLMFLLLQNVIICDEVASNSTRIKRSYAACGLSRKSEGLIIGGNQFKKGSYPWMTVLMDDTKSPPSYFCGGVLISTRKILSAAHCIFPKREFRRKLPRDVLVMLGVHNLNNPFELDRLLRYPQRIFIHPDWNPKITSYDGDIAVLWLEDEIQFTNAIQPICLWTYDSNPVDNKGILIGYGKSQNQKIEHETLPKQLEMPIINSNEDCFLREPDFAKISSFRTFCAGSTDGTGPCLGDSGHGLFIKYQNIFFLRGLVSASFLDGQTCDTTKYAVFTNVLKYKNWIDNPSEDYDYQPSPPIVYKQPVTARPQIVQKLQKKIAYDDSFCGIMSQSANLIQGGQFSTRSQFPWIAIIKVLNYGKWEHMESGSLISNKHVIAKSLGVSYYDDQNNLIAVAPNRVKILLGTIKYDDLSESGSMEVDAAKIINLSNTKKVSPRLIFNQVTIITLDREITFTEFIRPVCLWPFGDNINDIAGRDAYVVGYGWDQEFKNTIYRKHIHLTITDFDEYCKSTFREELPFRNETKLFCAVSKKGEAPCGNDDELYVKVESKWYLKGILGTFYFTDATNKACKDVILYEDIAPFVPWIQSQIN